MAKAKIPFFDCNRQHEALRTELLSAVDAVISSGRLIFGPALERFEREFATYTSASHCVGVSSGTDAIVVALMALGIGPGDEVITVANTAVPTVSAIRLAGATPVFADVDIESGLIDPVSAEAAVTTKTKAILPVHLYGSVCDMDAILRVAARHSLAVVEDCAQASGAFHHGRHVGTLGHAGCFSFYPTKNLGAIGDAGCVLTHDAPLAERMRKIRFYGFDSARKSVMEGLNARMVDMQAAILSVKLRRLPGWIASRREIASRYRSELRAAPLSLPPPPRAGCEESPHIFVVRHPSRGALSETLARRGIGTAIHYPDPIHLMPGYSFLNYKAGSLPATEARSKLILSLPLFPEMTDGEVARVIEAVNEGAR